MDTGGYARNNLESKIRLPHQHLLPWRPYASLGFLLTTALPHRTRLKFRFFRLLRNAADRIIDAIAIREYTRDRASP